MGKECLQLLNVQGLESDLIDLNKEILVQVKNIDTGQWEGPFQLITWG